MTIKELEKELRARDDKARIENDSPLSFRIFIYSYIGKKTIITFLEKHKKLFKIIKISDYPNWNKDYPICVIRLEKLRFYKTPKKTKKNAKTRSRSQL